ncbi:unnamed protein product [Bursaphelenchus okinawaensis]|uniref:Uncharacterized protein n=1 Tax=Bursaphelenchus okinawaensis TaxID=465554 RepID=A0A811KNP0_9BILA|nr:unnamed protein product [Bursaphelenchus okinawaensis]CAG9106427.1 unnamed protein product [Bursaphelenchus okinawaensis]
MKVTFISKLQQPIVLWSLPNALLTKVVVTLPTLINFKLAQLPTNPTDLSTMLQKLTQETVAKGTSDDINGDNKAEEEKRKLKEEESDKSVDDFELE